MKYDGVLNIIPENNMAPLGFLNASQGDTFFHKPIPTLGGESQFVFGLSNSDELVIINSAYKRVVITRAIYESIWKRSRQLLEDERNRSVSYQIQNWNGLNHMTHGPYVPAIWKYFGVL